MKRLYFLLPDVDVTREVVEEIRKAGVLDEDMYTLAKEGTPLEDLPEATIRERTDFVRGLEIGATGGGVIGMLAGLAAVTMPPAGIVLGGGFVIATSLMGASVSAILSSMIGLDYPNARLERFESAIEAGQILMLVDVPAERAAEIETLVVAHHPRVTVEERERTLSDVL